MKYYLRLLTVIMLLICNQNIYSQNTRNENQLPEQAVAFLAKHFRNHEIINTRIDHKNEETAIKLKSGHEIYFDAKGNWFKITIENLPLPKSIIDILPVNIIQYIAGHYPRRAIIKIERRVNEFELELSNSLQLSFDSKGKLLKTEQM